MAEEQTNEALEKLAQGLEESRREFQQRIMKLAREYFDDSVEELKQEVRENRTRLENLPEQVPGGQDEAFQMLFRELMNSYSRIEGCLEEAQESAAGLDLEQIVRQGEVDASEAARREAQELGVDLTQVEGTGSGGRVIIDDVRAFAEKMKAEAGEDSEAEETLAATEAARRSAERLGIDLSGIEGTGSGGAITVKDVTEHAGKIGEQADQTTQGVQEAAGQVAGQAQEMAQDTAGRGAQQSQETTGETAEEPKATNAARRKAEELGVDLAQVNGTGVDGLITLRDVTGS